MIKLENLNDPLNTAQIQRNFDEIKKGFRNAPFVTLPTSRIVSIASTVSVDFSATSNFLVKSSVNLTFTFTSLSEGAILYLTVHNTSGGSISLTWPSLINWVTTAPATLLTGDCLVLRIMSYGPLQSDVYVDY